MGVENIKLGICDVTFKGTALGLTKGGVELEVQTQTHETKVDNFGETIVNEFIQGRSVMIKIPMAETHLDNLALIMPGSKINTAKDLVSIGNGNGISLFETAGVMVLTPVGDPSEKITIPLANTKGSITFAYKHNEERVFNTEWTGYPDVATGEMFTVGSGNPDP